MDARRPPWPQRSRAPVSLSSAPARPQRRSSASSPSRSFTSSAPASPRTSMSCSPSRSSPVFGTFSTACLVVLFVRTQLRSQRPPRGTRLPSMPPDLQSLVSPYVGVVRGADEVLAAPEDLRLANILCETGYVE